MGWHEAGGGMTLRELILSEMQDFPDYWDHSWTTAKLGAAEDQVLFDCYNEMIQEMNTGGTHPNMMNKL